MGSLKDAITKTTSTESLLIENFLDKLFIEDREDKEDRVGMHGSGIIASDNEFCFRQQVLSFIFKGNEPLITVGLRKIFKQGWVIHQKWQNMFKQAGVAIGIEQRGESSQWNLLFTPDAIIKVGNRKYIVEIKSVNTYQFKNMKSHPSAEKQLQLYMHMTGIPRGFVLCEDKNTQETKIFVYEYDPVKAKPFVERMLKVQKYLKRYKENGKLPSRLCEDENCRRAKNCAYRNCCYNISKTPINKEEYEKMEAKW